MSRNIIIVVSVFLLAAQIVDAKKNVSEDLFATSKCLDLIASLQYFEKLKDNSQFNALAADSVFIQNLRKINHNVSASKLCNLYTTFHGDKNDLDSCQNFFLNLSVKADDKDSEWIKNILELQPELSYCITAVKEAGYSKYWDSKIKPVLQGCINSYPVSNETLDSIHSCLKDFAGSEELSETHSNIFVMNIDNAFNLSDESFCCTPLLLDKEMEKRFRLNFINVYIHENLHRLSISEALMKKLEELKEDDFYRENERIATRHREGLNEAFVVAAEVYISHKMGIRDDKSVYEEFAEYVDGSLVLAPIIYVNFDRRNKNESLNDFILRLFDDGTIKKGLVKPEYERAMAQIKQQSSKSATGK